MTESTSQSDARITPLTLRPRPLGRAVALVDLENLTAGRDAAAFAVAYEKVRRLAHLTDLDEIHVAADASHFSELMVALPATIGRHPGYGPDGADQALIAMTPDFTTHRFDRLVLASGDGRAFTLIAAAARQAGLAVDLVLGTGRCATSLRRQATRIHRLPEAA